MATNNGKNSKKVSLFMVDFFNKKIYGTKRSFELAGKGKQPAYGQLVKLLETHPEYELEYKIPEKRNDKPKETYKGFTVEFIQDYFSARDELDGTSNRADLDFEIAFAKSQKESRLCAAKEKLHELYDSKEKPFDYGEARDVVRDYKKKHFKIEENGSGSENELEAVEEDIDKLPLAVNE